MSGFGASSFFGMKCPKGCVTIQVGAVAGSLTAPTCPVCGSKLVANAAAPPVATNVYCAKCNAAFGMVSGSTCPICDGPFTAL